MICSLFFVFFDRNFAIENNIGQVGDFIGGLTNPILSFIALLVLLRTTMIQTAEARKTTDFLERQIEFMEREKFEATFFQILNRLEVYCEAHFRKPSSNAAISEGEKISRIVTYNSVAHGLLAPLSQLKAVKKDVRKVLYSDVCIGFCGRAMRVLRLINNANISDALKKSFSGLLIDSMYSGERKLLAHYVFFYDRTSRKLLRKWGFPRLKAHAFSSIIISDYYAGKVGV